MTVKQGRQGQRNAARRVASTTRPPWASWRTRNLHARAIRFMETYCVPRKGFRHGQPLKLARFQKQWLEEVFSGDDVDASVLTLPRGQGKSTFAGGVATWATFDQAVAAAFGGQPQIPVVAPTLKQASRGVYGAALGFVKNCPDMLDRSNIFTGSGEQRIVVPFNDDAELFPIAADPDGLQGLDPSLALIDEVGFIDVDSWDSLLLAAGKRERNLILGLGTRRPGNEPNALDHLLAQIDLHGTIDRFLLVDYHADAHCDIDDREQWHKANPALHEGFLREEAIEQARKLSPEGAFRCFRLNQKSETDAGWLGPNGAAIWRDLRDDYEMVLGGPVWAGVDVSLHHDSTSVVWAQPRPSGRLHVTARIWTPGESRPIPFDEVEQCIRDLSLQYQLQVVAFDPRYFAASAQRLEAEGIAMGEVPQQHSKMVPLIGETFRAIKAGALTHTADPQFTSHVLNARPFYGDTTGFSLSKKKSALHIDGCIAMALAVGTALLEPAEVELTDEMLRVY